ncbi:class I SAM-dependent methyltransferase [Indiicoccus explosivorum]|uniref:class I SAM-dependent methyltransferase n=1 Tax=Indiicoccus explosivorum TaxID=1917864 RepID=UPI000B432A56|nr:class I SAM-dependent methyltransferase [Indiicoccus explosivorum]
MKTIVTTAIRCTPETIGTAKQIAAELGLSFVERGKTSVSRIQEEHDSGVVAVTKERLEYYTKGSAKPFFFHPSSSAFRTRRPLLEDPLISVSDLEPGDVFIDCTLGMGSDAIVASARTGPSGKVIGCEADPVIAFIVGRGLKTYSELEHLKAPMERIEVIREDAAGFLQQLPDRWADVVYMDPMFDEPIKGAVNFDVFRDAAAGHQLDDRWVSEAIRVARKSVVLKAHFRSADFEKYGFERRVRPNTKFHYGVIRK